MLDTSNQPTFTPAITYPDGSTQAAGGASVQQQVPMKQHNRTITPAQPLQQSAQQVIATPAPAVAPPPSDIPSGQDVINQANLSASLVA